MRGGLSEGEWEARALGEGRREAKALGGGGGGSHW